MSPSASPSPTGRSCSAVYTVASSWQGGFQGEVTVTASGSSAIGGWTVAWAFPNGQTVTQLWNGALSQSGANVTVKNASYNGSLSPGGSTTFGFTGTWSGANGTPTSITCTPV
uniref:cellulose binding domain-containing protein n=1 Tax=Microtetraspora niveoalba TaxID=46175 RepID=UPI0035711272